MQLDVPTMLLQLHLLLLLLESQAHAPQRAHTAIDPKTYWYGMLPMQHTPFGPDWVKDMYFCTSQHKVDISDCFTTRNLKRWAAACHVNTFTELGRPKKKLAHSLSVELHHKPL